MGEFIPESPGATKESLAELWSDFLAREAESGMSESRRGSMSMRSGSLGGLKSPVLGRVQMPELQRKVSAASPIIKEENS